MARNEPEKERINVWAEPEEMHPRASDEHSSKEIVIAFEKRLNIEIFTLPVSQSMYSRTMRILFKFNLN